QSRFRSHHPPTTELYTLSLHDALPIYQTPICWIIHGKDHCSIRSLETYNCIGCLKGLCALGGRPDAYVAIFQYAPPYWPGHGTPDRKSTRLNSSHVKISYAVFCLKKKK